MRAISEKLKRIDTIVGKFNSHRDEFIATESRLKNALSKLIDSFSDEFELSKSNSVKKLRFYSIVSRVKESLSLAEKLVRNNDYNGFDKILEDYENYDPLVLKAKLKEIDDIIGVKILTDLNIDTINMFHLINSSKFSQEAKKVGIELNEGDLKIQPVKMKNGLKIYKIRGKFDDWRFELQIKNKLESAWGDMEHSIFYKDYRITPVRDLAEQSMNHAGKLLVEIDFFLQEIRNASENFLINSNVLTFITNFEERFSSILKEKLNGIEYNFKKIASVCYNIHQLNEGLLSNENFDTDYQLIQCEKYEVYIGARNESFDLQIFESIIINNLKHPIDESNIEQSLDLYFQIITESYVNMVMQNKLFLDEELAKELLNIFFDSCKQFDCKNYILYTNDVYLHVNNMKNILDSIEVLELEKEKIEIILSAYTIHKFHGKFNNFLEHIELRELLEYLEQTKAEIEKINIPEKEQIISDLSNAISDINK